MQQHHLNAGSIEAVEHFAGAHGLRVVSTRRNAARANALAISGPA